MCAVWWMGREVRKVVEGQGDTPGGGVGRLLNMVSFTKVWQCGLNQSLLPSRSAIVFIYAALPLSTVTATQSPAWF